MDEPCCTGYGSAIGEHVSCYRPADGARRCGVVEENRCGLFLACCTGGRVVLTAANWLVYATPACGSPAREAIASAE